MLNTHYRYVLDECHKCVTLNRFRCSFTLYSHSHQSFSPAAAAASSGLTLCCYTCLATNSRQAKLTKVRHISGKEHAVFSQELLEAKKKTSERKVCIGNAVSAGDKRCFKWIAGGALYQLGLCRSNFSFAIVTL